MYFLNGNKEKQGVYARSKFQRHFVYKFLCPLSLFGLVCINLASFYILNYRSKKKGQAENILNYAKSDFQNVSKITSHYKVFTPEFSNSAQINIGIAVMGCISRLDALIILLDSLYDSFSHSQFRIRVPVYVTMDCWGIDVEKDMIEVQKIFDMLNARLDGHGIKPLFYFRLYWEPFERDTTYRDERVARHWLFSVSRLFHRGFEYVVHLEEDHVVSLDFFVALQGIIQWGQKQDSGCYNMGCGGDCWGSISRRDKDVTWMEAGNMGVIYTQKFWGHFLQNSFGGISAFCSMRGNWDINVHTMQSRSILPVPCSTYAKTRVMHQPHVKSVRTSSVGSSNGFKSDVDSWRREVSAFQDVDDFVNLLDLGPAKYMMENVQYPILPYTIVQKCIATYNQSLIQF